jgi:broad specificity phosphatase PhoE
MNLPETLWLVRHGESIANIARHRAEAENLATIDFPYREADVPLSDAGIQQSLVMGKWFGVLPPAEKPTHIFTSPFVRTVASTKILIETAKLPAQSAVTDERLREREFGIFDRLTRIGSIQKYPEECERRERLGKYYYRPPGGESWCDVILRLRSFWDDLCEKTAGQRALIVTHEVVVRCFRCIIENIGEEGILAIDRASDVYNGAITGYKFEESSGGLLLSMDNILPKFET